MEMHTEPISEQSLPELSPEKSFAAKKVFLTMLGVICVLAIAGVSYYLGTQQTAVPVKYGSVPSYISQTPSVSPTPDLTANWQIYTAPIKFTMTGSPFSFKYPSEWKLFPNLRETTPTAISDIILYKSKNISDNKQLSVSIYANTKGETAQQFIVGHQLPTSQPNLTGSHYSKDTSVVIPNADWLIDRNAIGAGPNQSAVLMHNSTIVILSCLSCSNELTNQILSTFTFN